MNAPARTARVAGPLAAVVALALLGGCAPASKPLYQWAAFPRQQYEWLLREGATPQAQIATLEAQAEQARATDGRLPPGLRAHLGLAYLSAGQPDAARSAWQAEKLAFPESAPYMDRLLQRLGAPGSSTPSTPRPSRSPA